MKADLRLVFRSNAKVAVKKERLAKRYELNLTDDMAEEMNTMCNLSEGIFEDGVKQGVKQGAKETKEKMMQAFQMLKGKVSVAEIVKKTGLAEDDIRQMKLLLG